MAKNPLEEAEALFRRRRWADLISLLEPLTAVYRESARFSVLLGCAYLHREDTGGAYSCFRRAQSLDYRDVDAALGLAAVHIRRGESDKAVQQYIDVIERHPRDRRAKRGLGLLRKTASGGDEAVPARRLRSLYPRPRRRWGVVAAVAAAAAAMTLAALAWPSIAGAIRDAKPQRDGVAAFSLSAEEAAAPVGSDGEFDIVMTEREALEAFEKAKRLFSDYRDEAALVELNRLLVSNATRQVKAKATALAQYVREPSFLSMPDRYSYAEVAAFPRLYDGVGVVWKGLPANIASSGSSTSFDLLVGYHDRKRLEGIVPVKMAFESRLLPDRPIEVLARVRTQGKAFYLECLAIHEQ